MSEQHIEAILFDLGGVIVEIVGMDRLLRWSRELPDMETMWLRWLASPAVRCYETGRSSREAFARDVIEEFGFDVDAATSLAEFARWPRRLYPDSAPLLQALRGRFRLASLSNTNEIHWDRYEREWALPGLFHANFPSGGEGGGEGGRMKGPHYSEDLYGEAGRDH